MWSGMLYLHAPLFTGSVVWLQPCSHANMFVCFKRVKGIVIKSLLSEICKLCKPACCQACPICRVLYQFMFGFCHCSRLWGALCFLLSQTLSGQSSCIWPHMYGQFITCSPLCRAITHPPSWVLLTAPCMIKPMLHLQAAKWGRLAVYGRPAKQDWGCSNVASAGSRTGQTCSIWKTC